MKIYNSEYSCIYLRLCFVICCFVSLRSYLDMYSYWTINMLREKIISCQSLIIHNNIVWLNFASWHQFYCSWPRGLNHHHYVINFIVKYYHWTSLHSRRTCRPASFPCPRNAAYTFISLGANGVSRRSFRTEVMSMCRTYKLHSLCNKIIYSHTFPVLFPHFEIICSRILLQYGLNS